MLPPLVFSKRIPFWVNLIASISSIPCVYSIQINPENNQNVPKPTDLEEKIQFLGNKLHPDNLIKVLHATTDINSAVKIFKWAALQKRFNHTANTYYWIIFKLGMAGLVDEMEGLCQNMVKDGCPGVDHSLLSLVDSFVKHCRINEAVRVLASTCLAGYKPSINVFNFVLGVLVEEKRGFQDVVFVYKEMVKAGVAPTVDTLNYLLEVLFETNRVDSAMDQYKRMNNKGCSPNSRTFEIVIKGLIAKNQVDDSIAILHDILELGCFPEFSFYASTIPLFCREDKLEEGIRLFKMMRASNFVPDSFTYGALIQCLCKNLRLDDAVNLLEEMIKNCLIPADYVFVDIVNGFCKLGKINKAMKLLEDKHTLGTSPHNALLGHCCDAGKFFVANCLLEKMSQRNIADSDSWNILIRWLCENVEIRKAYELLGRMVISSWAPDCATYSALVVGNCRLCKYEDALQLFLQLRSKCWVLDSVSYSELIEGLCRAEKYLEAVEVFHYMSMSGCSIESFVFHMLVKGLCDTGMVTKAVRLQLLACTCGTSCVNATYNYIMLGLSKSDRGKNLFVFLLQMLVQGCNLDAEAYCILIQNRIAENQIRDCALFFNTMVNKGFVPDSDTLYNLLACLASHSQLYLISSTINKLLSEFEVLDSAMYNILINGLWKEGNKNEACLLLDLMLEKGWVPDATTHGLLIGSVDGDGTGKGSLSSEGLTIKDDVSDILAEGLGEI